MNTIELYRDILNKIIGAYNDLPEPKQNANDVWIDILINDRQYPLLTILDEENDVTIYEVQIQREDEPDFGKYEGTYISLIIDNIQHVEQRLIDLDDFEANKPEWLGNVSDDKTVQLANINGFIAYGNGLITHNGKPIKAKPQELCILSTLLCNSNTTASTEELVSECTVKDNEDMEGSKRNDFISKVISPVNKLLKAQIGYKPIAPHNNRKSWVLSFNVGS